MTRLEYHRQQYNKATAEYEQTRRFHVEIKGKKMGLIRDKLKQFGISCEKYDYTFDESTRCPGTNKAMVYLSLDEKELLINK